MRARHGWLGLALGVGLVGACRSDLVLSLEGKACRSAEPRCVPGFECVDAVCVRGLRASFDAGQSGAPFGSFGAEAGASGDARADASSGGVGSMSSGGSIATGGDFGQGGASELDRADAMAPDTGVDAGCTPLVLYPDQDRDGVGVTGQGELRCPSPGWVTTPGDCRDDLPEVHLGQTSYFGAPFPDPTRSPELSFDYDCSGSEQPDPDNAATGAPPVCSQFVGGVNCSGSGYLDAAPARSGPGVEARCGSNTLRTCVTPAALTCAASDVAVEAPFRCR